MDYRGLRAPTLAAALVLSASLLPAVAQRADRPASATRRVATLEQLVTYPGFYHGTAVRVRGDLSELKTGGAGGDLMWQLTMDDRQVRVVAASNAQFWTPPPGTTAAVELTALFLDVGRLDQADPKATEALIRLSERLLNKRWPAIGELLLLAADGGTEAPPLTAPTVRTIALVPGRYIGQDVTVTGRFRGRNLYGDLPDAPGISRWDFVLQSRGAAVWVVGRRPRGAGFDLNPDRRVDTGRWLEVSGTVREDRGLVRLDARAVRAASPASEPGEAEAVVRVPEQGPPPEVVFSAPTQDETGVERNAPIRIQFSRDMKPESFAGQVTLSYVTQTTAPLPPFTIRYDEGRRVLEIRFASPLDAFQTIKVEIRNGVLGTDGQRLVPWAVTFTIGG